MHVNAVLALIFFFSILCILILWGFTKKSNFYGVQGGGAGGHKKPIYSGELSKKEALDSLQI